jgi:ubiquinone/menaquinone biosynthesis C-methylase UbiE
MGCHGGFFLDEETRRSWFNPEKVLEEMGLHLGMVFVDVGCGEGFFTLLAAQVVGETGKVYAVDTDPLAIERLRYKASEKGITNVTAIVGKGEETVFCDSCADIVFYSIVLHDFNQPSRVLANAHRMLRHSGKLVNLDWKKKHTRHGPPSRIRFSETQAQQLIEAAGFKIEKVKDVGSDHYLITAGLDLKSCTKKLTKAN